VRVGDWVEVLGGERGSSRWVARLIALWQAPGGDSSAAVAWAYTPEELPGGRRATDGAREVFPTTTVDVVDVDTILRRVRLVLAAPADAGGDASGARERSV
jgi:hypothetical protein